MNLITYFKKILKDINDDFVILKVDGGLGSVILQYTLGLKIKKLTNKDVKFDATWYEGECFDCDKKNTYDLSITRLFPNIEFNLATKEEIQFFTKYYNYENPHIWEYNDFLFTNRKPKIFSGYYSHYKYWYDMEDILQEKLDFSSWELDDNNSTMREKILNSKNSVAIHIRRGDFVALGWCCLERDYYINAIKYLQEKIGEDLELFFFSNDYEYVQKEILPYINNTHHTLVDINNHYTGYLDLYLMTLCNYQIIANSTFSICSALLNKNKDKIIVAPNTFGYGIRGDKTLSYSGIETSIQNPNWTILNYKNGNIVRERL